MMKKLKSILRVSRTREVYRALGTFGVAGLLMAATVYVAVTGR